MFQKHPKTAKKRNHLPTKSQLTLVESSSNSQNGVKSLLSSTYWEVPIFPFAFSMLLGGSFISNIFFVAALYFQQLIGRFHFLALFSATYRQILPSLKSLYIEGLCDRQGEPELLPEAQRHCMGRSSLF